MSNILIRGGTVITLDHESPVLPGADVAITDGEITFVGVAPATGFERPEIVDATGKLVLPGLYNAATHSGTVFWRGLSGPDGPEPWFDLSITRDGQIPVPAAPPMSGEEAYWAALLVAAEMIRGGVAGFGDQYFFMEEVARAALESGLRANLAWCTFGSDVGEVGGDIADVAAFTEKWQGADGGRIRTSLGPHSAYACSPQFLARTAAVAARLGAGIRLRASESLEQVDMSLLAYDMTPIEVLDKNGVLDAPACLANASHLADHDFEILAGRVACVVACPTAQLAARVAPTPIARLLEAGITVGLGTDGAGLSGSLDMFAVIRDAWRQLGGTREAATQALRLATEGSSQALGFGRSGRLAAGFSGDLILVETRRPHLTPLNDPLLALVTSVTSADVTDTMVAGEWLMRDRRLTALDDAGIIAEAHRRRLTLAR
jgi:5-methylthioadenosine/S-adenosylhomocysteine deaminase